MTRAMEHLILSWTQTKRPRSNTWASTIAHSLAIDLDTAPRNEAVSILETGVRVLVSDRAPEIVTSSLRSTKQPAVRIVDPAVAEALYDSATSVTDVSRFAECPRNYYFSRFLKWERARTAIAEIDEEEWELRDDGLDAAELGTQVHDLLAGQQIESPDPDALALAERFRLSEIGAAAAKARVKAHEWDFVLAAYDVVLRGQIDLWFESGRELVIVDYKTDRVQPPIAGDSIRGYTLQLQIYASALERALGRAPSRAVLHFLRPNIIVDVDISPLARSAAFDKVMELKTAQHRLDFAAREGEQCARCDYARECGRTS
jgi:ATP-dependent exoDNAse (exonuclease V) beta subunit